MLKKGFSPIFSDLEEFYNVVKGCCHPSYREAFHEGFSISEDEKHLYIDAKLPGVKAEDVEVTVNPKKRSLLIQGKGSADRENVQYHLKSQNTYSYEIPLSNEIDIESHIDAISKDGILSITLAKNKSHKPLKVEVKVA